MDTSLLVALVGLGSTLVGAVAGGLISHFSSKSARDTEWKREAKAKELAKIESIFGEFITEANNLFLRSVGKKISNPEELSHLLSLETHIYFHSEALGDLANEIILAVMDANLKEQTESPRPFLELKTAYIEKCRAIFQSMENGT